MIFKVLLNFYASSLLSSCISRCGSTWHSNNFLLKVPVLKSLKYSFFYCNPIPLGTFATFSSWFETSPLIITENVKYLHSSGQARSNLTGNLLLIFLPVISDTHGVTIEEKYDKCFWILANWTCYFLFVPLRAMANCSAAIFFLLWWAGCSFIFFDTVSSPSSPLLEDGSNATALEVAIAFCFLSFCNSCLFF